MNRRRTVLALLGFMIGALSDGLFIRNGLSLSGPTLLDTYPVIWPVWLVAVLISSFVLEILRGGHLGAIGPSRESVGFSNLPIPLAILLGMVITHTALLIRDITIDTTSHNLWPFEYLFWGVAVGAPAYIGSMLARLILKQARP